MRRRSCTPFLCRLAATAAAAAVLLLATGLSRAADILIVLSGQEAPYAAAKDAAVKILTAQGHSVRFAQLGEINKDIKAAMGQKVDAYLAIGTKAATALHGNVPDSSRLAYCMVAAPSVAGLAEGAPAQGVSMDVPISAQVQLMTRAMGEIKTIGMLYRSDSPASQALQSEIDQAKGKDIRLVSVAVDKCPSVAAAIESLLDQRPDIIWTAPDSSVYDSAAIRSLLLASVRKKTPVFGYSTGFVKAGALMGIGIDPRTQGEQGAAVVLDLLNNPPATSTHCVVGAKFQLVLNLVVAERLSISLSCDLVASADLVFRPEEDKP